MKSVSHPGQASELKKRLHFESVFSLWMRVTASITPSTAANRQEQVQEGEVGMTVEDLTAIRLVNQERQELRRAAYSMSKQKERVQERRKEAESALDAWRENAKFEALEAAMK